MAKGRLSEAGGSKLARRQTEQDTPREEGVPPLVTGSAGRLTPTSFKLRPSDIARLQRLTEELSEAAGRPLARTDVLRGMLLHAERTDRRKMLDAIKDALFEAG
jgi:hypothetical protein